MQKIRNRTSPTVALGLRRSAVHTRPPRGPAIVDGLGRRRLDQKTGHRSYPFARARGSSHAIAMSQTNTATSTATVNSMNSTCISG